MLLCYHTHNEVFYDWNINDTSGASFQNQFHDIIRLYYNRIQDSMIY